MVFIFSPAQLIAMLPSCAHAPFASKEDLVAHLLFAFNKKEEHGFILKSCDNQSFCALVYRQNTRSLLNKHFGTRVEDDNEVAAWTPVLDNYFKRISFETAPFFTV